MNDTFKMFLISLITAVLVQILLGPQIMKLSGMVPAQSQPMMPQPQMPVPVVTPPPETAATPTPQPVPAPDFRGITEKKARALADSQGITIVRTEQRDAPEKRPGEILEQDPAPGTLLQPTNKEIRVVIAKGKEDVRIPDVVGKTLEEARTELENAGFEVPDPLPQDSNKTPGTVLSQDPKPNARGSTGSDVKLTIASLPLLEVPKVTGKYLRAAKTELQEVGLEVGAVRRVEHAEHGEGYVLRQDPASGAKVPFGTEITLTVVAPN
jgi:eukaryotic-like serine/threonine-protein kinase